MLEITLQEKIGRKSRYELERITFLLDKYSKENKYNFADGLSFLLAKSGYRNYDYIPCDNSDLCLISDLSVKYMKTYSIRVEEFIHALITCFEYCKVHGYSPELYQSTLKVY